MQSDIVLSSRVRLARNYADLPFDLASEPEQAETCILRTLSALRQAGLEEQYDLLRLRDMSDVSRRAMEESHLVSRDLLLMVRTLPATENGLPVQIYCFSSDKNWPSYESIQAEIMEHFVAVLPAFELYAFQRTGARDVLLNGIAASGKADLATMETAPLHTDPSEKQGT